MATYVDANTLALWRLDDDVSATLSLPTRDNTGLYDLKSGTVVARVAPAKVDAGYNFNGTSSVRLAVSANDSWWVGFRDALRTGVLTFECWVQLGSSPPAAEQCMFACGSSTAGSTGNELFRIAFNTSRVLTVAWQHSSKTDVTVTDSSASVWAVSTWYRLGVSVNIPGNSISFWRDGAKLSTVTGPWTAPSDGTVGIPVMGRRAVAASGWFKGFLDHVHISKVAYDDATMATRQESLLNSTAKGYWHQLKSYSGGMSQPRTNQQGRNPPINYGSTPNTPITVAAVSPTPGTAITQTTPLVFSVTDVDAVGRLFISVELASQGIREVVWDGDSWGPKYQGVTNQRVAGGTAGDWTYTILRDGGWPESPVVHVDRGDS